MLIGGHSIVRAIVRLCLSRRRARRCRLAAVRRTLPRHMHPQPPAVPLRRVRRLQGSISAGKIRHSVRLATNFRHPGHSIVPAAGSLSGCRSRAGRSHRSLNRAVHSAVTCPALTMMISDAPSRRTGGGRRKGAAVPPPHPPPALAAAEESEEEEALHESVEPMQEDSPAAHGHAHSRRGCRR